MAQDGNLPFDRGTTFKDGFTASTAVPHVALQIAGNAYQTNDDSEDGHDTGQVIELMPVVNRSGGALTLSRAGVRISTLNTHAINDSVNKAGPANNTAGNGLNYAWVPDDRYTSGQSIGQGDLFYVIKRGAAKCRMSTRGGNNIIAANDALCWTTGGTLRDVATLANAQVVAIALETATTANVQKLVRVIQQG